METNSSANCTYILRPVHAAVAGDDKRWSQQNSLRQLLSSTQWEQSGAFFSYPSAISLESAANCGVMFRCHFLVTRGACCGSVSLVRYFAVVVVIMQPAIRG